MVDRYQDEGMLAGFNIIYSLPLEIEKTIEFNVIAVNKAIRTVATVPEQIIIFKNFRYEYLGLGTSRHPKSLNKMSKFICQIGG